MRGTESGGGSVRVALIAAMILGLLGGLVALATAAEPDRARLERKVQVLESILDEVLVQSPNVVVSSPGGSARGLVLDGYGAVFTLRASLAGHLFVQLKEAEKRMVAGDKDFKFYFFSPDKNEEGSAETGAAGDTPEVDPAKRLVMFKAELTDAMLDYGPTLTELRDDDWLVVAAFLDGRRLLVGGDGTRLVLRARMRDLRQYASGALSREAAAKKVLAQQE